MITGLKKTFRTVEDLDKTKKELRDLKKEFKETQGRLEGMHAILEKIADVTAKTEEKRAEEHEKSVAAVKEVASDFQHELNDFKLMKTKLNTKMVSDVSSDVKKELQVYVMNAKQQIEHLNSVSDDVVKITQQTKDVMDSVNELKRISAQVKEQDFSLTKYAKELEKNDREKLALMRKLDTMERLVAKMRRESRASGRR